MSLLSALLGEAVLEFVDVDGRRLGEQASTAAVEMAVRRCPWSGERLGGEMNVSAWRQVSRHWPAVLSRLAQASGPTAGGVWRGLSVLRWMPLGMAQPLDGPTAATFKTALGLQRPLTSWLLLDGALASGGLSAVCAPEQLLERLSDEGWLVGHRQVCAGPPERIVEAWRCLSEPEPSALPVEAVDVGERCVDLVAGAWAVLGATRTVLREGRIEEAPGWSPAGEVAPGLPAVLRVLRSDGPTALVREVPRFEPEWTRHLFSALPARVDRAVAGARGALATDLPLGALDLVWARLVDDCGMAPR